MEYVKFVAENYQKALLGAKIQYGDNLIPINHKEIKIGGIFGTKIFARDATELIAGIPERIREKDRESMEFKPPEYSGSENRLQEKVKEKRHQEIIMNNLSKFPNKSALKKMNSEPVLGQDSYEKNSSSLNEKSLLALKTLSNKKMQFDFSENHAANLKKNRAVLSGNNALDVPGNIDKELINYNNYSVNKKAEGKTGFENIQKSLEEILNSINNLQLKNKGNTNKSFYETPLVYWEKKLLEADFSLEYTDSIMQELKDSLSVNELKESREIEKNLILILENKIPIAPPLMKANEKRKVVMFIGATGVGKTTTLAKLGANYTFHENRKVAFITIDNYRIAATEQLKRYSTIINIPTHVVNQVGELEKTLKSEEAELILIDTSGRGPFNKDHIQDCIKMLEGLSMPVEKILITQATLKRSDQEIVFQCFEKIGIDKVILSKTDETKAIGGFFEIADKYNKGLSYVTFGQDVPSDIEIADSTKLAKLILRDYTFKGISKNK